MYFQVFLKKNVVFAFSPFMTFGCVASAVLFAMRLKVCECFKTALRLYLLDWYSFTLSNQ